MRLGPCQKSDCSTRIRADFFFWFPRSVNCGHAGLHPRYTFNQPLDDALLTSRALAEGVIIRPLSLYYLDQTAPRPPGMNLGYAAVSAERIGPACAKLAGGVEKLLVEEKKRSGRRR